MMSVQVDQIKQSRITWNNKYLNPNSNEYITLEDEAVYAVSTYFVMNECKYRLDGLIDRYIHMYVGVQFHMNIFITLD